MTGDTYLERRKKELYQTKEGFCALYKLVNHSNPYGICKVDNHMERCKGDWALCEKYRHLRVL